MTVNRKQKQAVRAFAETHSVSYSEALRLLGLKIVQATIRSTEGECYWLWIDGSQVEVSWWVSETESAHAVGSLSQWMSTADPRTSGWGRLTSDGRVRAAAASSSLWGSMPFLPTDVVNAVRELIEERTPSWETPSQSELDYRDYIAREGSSAGLNS